MTDFLPKTPIPLQIRKIIFENYNRTEEHFTNDDILEILKRGGDVDPTWTVVDIEQYINAICDSGMTRNIAQNLTTVWLKLFDVVEKHACSDCGFDVFLGKSEDQICPNVSCGTGL